MVFCLDTSHLTLWQSMSGQGTHMLQEWYLLAAISDLDHDLLNPNGYCIGQRPRMLRSCYSAYLHAGTVQNMHAHTQSEDSRPRVWMHANMHTRSQKDTRYIGCLSERRHACTLHSRLHAQIQVRRHRHTHRRRIWLCTVPMIILCCKLHMHVSTPICMHVFVCICVCVHVHTRIHLYTRTHMH
jgi:hypothetical protein